MTIKKKGVRKRMGLSSKRPLMRRQKGWIGFVRSYKKYINSGGYENVEWGEGSLKPKSVSKDVMGKEIQKW